MTGPHIHIKAWGSGPTLLCLHGLGGGVHFFSGLGPALADRWRVVAIDLPGSGFDIEPAAFSFDRAADRVASLLGQEPESRPVVLGHSLGTIVALEAMRRAPGILSGFIAVGGLPEPLPASRVRIAARIDEVRQHGLAGLGELVATANMARRTCEERPELVGLFGRLFERQDAAAYCSMADALVQWKARPLPNFEGVPSFLISGEEDVYAPPDAVRAFAATLPAGTRAEVMRDCGHLPFLERPDAFASVIARVLDDWQMRTPVTL